jgi:hypothetical protein
VVCLERSLRRSRWLTAALGLGCLVVAAAAFAPQAQEAQTPEQLTTQRLVLTNAQSVPAVVLVAGPDASLIVQTPEGAEVIRLGGPAARRVGH